ncbi:MAG: class I SAM-dependent methyltransferase [Actinomycetota bacterium]
MGTWDDLADWWAAEVQDDPAYEGDVHPILVELLEGTAGSAIDLGCGEGQGMRLVGGEVFGTDLSMSLLERAQATAPVVQAVLPGLSWVRDASLDRAISVYLVDLIADHGMFFAETARIVKPGGHLVVVINHPVFTAPGSAPFIDDDGQVLWRWGTYFEPGSSSEPAGDGAVEFFHRPVADILTSAARSGWVFEEMIERGLSEETIARIPGYAGQEHVPRLAGFKWKRA